MNKIKKIFRPEILEAASLVAQEKSLQREDVIVVTEEAIAEMAREHYGRDSDVRVKIDRNSGEISFGFQ